MTKPPAIGFEDDEFEAVIAGLVMLERLADQHGELADSAAAALARIEAALPDEPTGAVPRARKGDGPHHRTLRAAIRDGTKLRLRYVDRKDKTSERTIWPLELGFFGAGETIAVWCEGRQDFRHFRLDRIVALEATGERYPGRRRILVARLRVQEADQYF